ncbi:phage portal protein, partial [Microcystis wesenbergii]
EMAGQRVTSLEPGAIEVLNPGESFEGFAPTRPNQGFDAFIRMMLRGVAAGIGLSYEALSRDFSNTSYSSARTSLMDERDNYRVIQSWFVRRLHKRIYKKWLDLAVLSGSLKIGDYELNRRFYQKAKFTPRGWQWVDPQNEIAANKEGVKAGFVSITDVVAQQGLDVEDVLQEQKRILDLAKDLGLSLDVLAEGGEQEPPPPAEGMTPIRIMPEQQRSEDFILGDYTVTSLLEYRSLKQMGVDIFFDILPGLTRTFSPRKRARNCKKGIACGDTCIAKNRVCKQNLSPAVASQVPPAKAKTKKAAGGATTASAAPAAPSAPAPAASAAPAAPAAPQTTVSKGADPNLQKTLDTYQKEAKDSQRKIVPNSTDDALLKASEASWSGIKRANKAGQDVIFLKDENGKVVAAASLKEKTDAGITATYVDYIAVRPDNLPTSLNKDIKVPGAGKQLLDQIITEAHSQGKDVAVGGFSSSDLTDYFEKAGFSYSGKVDKKYKLPIYVNASAPASAAPAATSTSDPDPADLLFGPKKPKKPKAPTSQSASSSDSASPSVSSSEFKPNGIYTQEKYDSLNTEHKKRLFRIASGGGDDRPADEQKKGDTALNKFNNANYYQSKKREKILKDNPDLTKAEANAVAHWINHEYQTVNKSIYAPDSLSLKDKTLGEAAAIRLSQGIRKMPPVTAQEVTKQAALRGRQAELAKDGKLRRHVGNLPDVDAFLAPYIQAQKSGQAHIEPTVFATTARNNHGFGDGAQVTFEIKAKMDGTGAGRTVDQYKTKAWEAEVLYPASTGFKVNKIKKKAGITIVELEEI